MGTSRPFIEHDNTDTDRPPVYWEEPGLGEPILHVRASMMANCAKSLAALSTGLVKPPSFSDAVLRAFQQGHDWEDRLLSMWKDSVGGVDWGWENPQHSISVTYETPHGPVVVSGGMDLFVQEAEEDDRYREQEYADLLQIVVDAKTVSDKIDYAPGEPMRAYMFEKYKWQMRVYADGVKFAESIPRIVITVGRINRDTGELTNTEPEVYNFSYTEVVESTGGPDGPRNKAILIATMSAKAEEKGLGGLATFPCTKNPYTCPVGQIHALISPSEQLNLVDVPEPIQEALKTLDNLRKGAEAVKAKVSAEKKAKASIRKWLVEMGDAGVAKRTVGPWNVNLSQGDAKEEVKISARELREILGVQAEDYIQTKEGTKTMTVEYVGDWVGE